MEPDRAEDIRWPSQLWPLCTSVAFERAAFYGLQSVLALYLADVLLSEGSIPRFWLLPELARLTGAHGVALAGIVTGAFVSAAVLAPAIGGIIADRLIGQHRAILAGGGMMAAGHGLLTLEAALLPALGLIALGSGLFKGPVAARLSGLYALDDPQRVEGFRLFYLAINLAGLAAPLVIGTLGERVDWHAAFVVSCAAMLAGLAIYQFRFAAIRSQHVPIEEAIDQTSAIPRTGPLSLMVLALSLALLTVPNAQIPNAYLIWVKHGFTRSIWGWDFPASWMIAADGLLGLGALAASGLFWRVHEQRQGAVDAATKAMVGAIFVIAGTALLVLAGVLHHGDSKVPVFWGLGFQLCNCVGLANVLPAAMAMFGQSSTSRNAATAMAGFYLALFAGGVASTLLASQFTSLPVTTFWLLHAFCALFGTFSLALGRHRSMELKRA